MRPRNRRSQMLVTISLALPVLIALLGFGFDFSLHYYHWMLLQKAADAGALAGASQLNGSPPSATVSANVVACAELYACYNGAGIQPQGVCPMGGPSCTASIGDPITVTPARDGRSVSVSIRREVAYYFLRFAGRISGPVAAMATAGVLPTSSSCRIAPLGLPCQQGCTGIGCYGTASAGSGDSTCGGAYTANGKTPSAGTVVQLKSDKSVTGIPGNWEPLTLGGNGASVYRKNMATGYQGMLSAGDTVITETGNIVGPTEQGFAERMNGHVLNSTVPATISPGDPQVVLVPLVDYTQATKGGKAQVPVLDFIMMYITGVSGNDATIKATVIPPFHGAAYRRSRGSRVQPH
jgi:Flp pilus assembly protein TadG